MKERPLLKVAVLGICAFGWTAIVSARASTVALWSFEDTVPSALPNTWSNQTPSFQAVSAGPFSSDLSTFGTGAVIGVHTNPATYWLRVAGNGSLRAFNSDHWGPTDYYQFSFSPAPGFAWSNLTLDWDQTRSASGPSAFYLAYSMDGSIFTKFDSSDYTLASSPSWSSTVPTTVNHQFRDLSLTTALNDALNAGSTVYFRVVCDVTPSSTGGTSRIDNFTIAATVPEPVTGVLFGLGLLVCWSRLRRGR